MDRKPDFFFITGEFIDKIVYSCWILEKLHPGNPNASAILVKIDPSFFYEEENKITEVILATTPEDALFPKPKKFPVWVTMYQPLKPIIKDAPLKETEITIIDKGDIFENISDIPKNYLKQEGKYVYVVSESYPMPGSQAHAAFSTRELALIYCLRLAEERRAVMESDNAPGVKYYLQKVKYDEVNVVHDSPDHSVIVDVTFTIMTLEIDMMKCRVEDVLEKKDEK